MAIKASTCLLLCTALFKMFSSLIFRGMCTFCPSVKYGTPYFYDRQVSILIGFSTESGMYRSEY